MSWKLYYSLVLLGVVVLQPLMAMDMDRVNALAEQIKAGVVTPPEKKISQESTSQNLEEVEQKRGNLGIVTSQFVSEESLGLRKTNLYTEDNTKPVEAKYTTAAPGTSKRFDRAYENAPPMIPHSVDGLLPITKNNNACLGCHMPDVAKSMGATPIPPSHFTNFRPMTKIAEDGKMIKEGMEIANTSDIKVVARQENRLYQGRFNCSQCHAPQAQIDPLVKNNFTPDYRNPQERHKSNLLDVINEGVQ